MGLKQDSSQGWIALAVLVTLAILIATGKLKELLAWFGGVFLDWLW